MITSYSQNQYCDICVLGETKFAIFSKEITNNISVDLEDYNVIVLSPLSSETDISIKANSVIFLTEGISKDITINTNNSALVSIWGTCRDMRINAGNSAYIGMDPENRRMIKEKFLRGIEGKDSLAICEALVETVRIVEPLAIETSTPYKFIEAAPK